MKFIYINLSDPTNIPSSSGEQPDQWQKIQTSAEAIKEQQEQENKDLQGRIAIAHGIAEGQAGATVGHNGLSGFYDRENPGMFFGGRGNWFSRIKNSNTPPGRLVANTSRAIDTIVENSMTSLSGNLSHGNAENKIESHILEEGAFSRSPLANLSSSDNIDKDLFPWQKGKLPRALRRTRRNLDISYSSVRAYRAFISAAKDKVYNEYDTHMSQYKEYLEPIQEWADNREEKEENMGALGSLGRWVADHGLAPNRWLSRRKRFHRFSIDYKAKIDAMFRVLEENLNSLEEQTKHNKEAMEYSIKTELENGVDRDAKLTFISDIIQNPALLTRSAGTYRSELSRLFKVGNDTRDALDFLEAIKSMELVMTGADAMIESNNKSQAQEGLLLSVTEQEKYIEDNKTFRFDALLQTDEFGKATGGKGRLSTAGVETPTTAELVRTIEQEIRTYGEDIDAMFTSNMKTYGMVTDIMKLTRFVRALVASKPLRKSISLTTRRKLIKWTLDRSGNDVDTENSFEQRFANGFKNMLTNTGGSTGLLPQANTIMTDMDTLLNSEGKIDTTRKAIFDSNVRIFHTQFEAARSYLSRNRNSIHPDDRTPLEECWNKIALFKSDIDSFCSGLNENDKREKENAVKISNLDTEIATLVTRETDEQDNISTFISTLATSTARNPNISPLQSALERTRVNLQSKRNERNNLEKPIGKPSFNTTHSTTLTQSIADINSHTTQTDTNFNFPTFAANIKKEIFNEFQGDLKEKFIKQMEANDQFGLLQKCIVGKKVKLNFCEVSAITEMNMPSELTSSLEEEYTVERVETDGIHLTNNINSNKSVFITGPSIKNGELQKNLIFKTSQQTLGTARTPGFSNASTTIYGTLLNAKIG